MNELISSDLDYDPDTGWILTLQTEDVRVHLRVDEKSALQLRTVLQPIQDYADEYESVRGMYAATAAGGAYQTEFGDFSSDDPLERYQAHQRAKGRA